MRLCSYRSKQGRRAANFEGSQQVDSNTATKGSSQADGRQLDTDDVIVWDEDGRDVAKVS